ncbi:MAG: hypothetical protein IKO75_07945 [Bacteroidales bacterium]|nr:hypothetical protein [Bacteroidales bacterium]
MSSETLQIALKHAVDDLGFDVLKSPNLVNILADYHALDVHDPVLKEKKGVIKSLVAENYYDKISEWRNKADTYWESKDSDWLNRFCNKTSLKRTVVEPIADSMKIVAGLKQSICNQEDIEEEQNKKVDSDKRISEKTIDRKKAMNQEEKAVFSVIIIVCVIFIGVLISLIGLLAVLGIFLRNYPF